MKVTIRQILSTKEGVQTVTIAESYNQKCDQSAISKVSVQHVFSLEEKGEKEEVEEEGRCGY